MSARVMSARVVSARVVSARVVRSRQQTNPSPGPNPNLNRKHLHQHPNPSPNPNPKLAYLHDVHEPEHITLRSRTCTMTTSHSARCFETRLRSTPPIARLPRQRTAGAPQAGALQAV